MVIAIPHPLILEQFLQLPYIKDSPDWEFIQGEAIQKPMPGGKHSRLQSCLGGIISALNSSYEAFPELRCMVSGRSMVPDLAVLATNQIPVDTNGAISTEIRVAPDWVIEILSPEQSQMKVTGTTIAVLTWVRYGMWGWNFHAGGTAPCTPCTPLSRSPTREQAEQGHRLLTHY